MPKALNSQIFKFLWPKRPKKHKTGGMDDLDLPSLKFPDTLQGFGYQFENGELRNIETGEKFEFAVRESDHDYNQQHYEALGKVIEKHVYELLETDCGLHRLPVPSEAYLKDLMARETWGAAASANQTDDSKTSCSKATSECAHKDHDFDAEPEDAGVALETASIGTEGESGIENESNLPKSCGTDSSSAPVCDEDYEENATAKFADDMDSRNTISSTNEKSGFIFASEGWNEQEKLIVLIHGSGVVRAGQWARRLIINDNLSSGTQIPFIKEALGLGYGVLVLNTNQNFIDDSSSYRRSIRGSESPVAHACHVWRYYITAAAAQSVAVVAHSYGGVVVTRLFQEYMDYFKEKVFSVALTDSVHCTPLPPSFGYFIKISRNWVTSSQPLDTTPLRIRACADVPLVSAGVTSHEMTSWASMKSIFKFFEERLAQRFAMDVDDPSEIQDTSHESEKAVEVSDIFNLCDEDKHEVQGVAPSAQNISHATEQYASDTETDGAAAKATPDTETGGAAAKATPDTETGGAAAKATPDTETGGAAAKAAPDTETGGAAAKTTPDTETGGAAAKATPDTETGGAAAKATPDTETGGAAAKATPDTETDDTQL